MGVGCRVRRKQKPMERKPKDLNPLVPLDELKAFVGKVLSVPKSEIDRREAELQKRNSKTKSRTRST